MNFPALRDALSQFVVGIIAIGLFIWACSFAIPSGPSDSRLVGDQTKQAQAQYPERIPALAHLKLASEPRELFDGVPPHLREHIRP